MTRKILLVAVVALGVAGARGQAQEAYTLKIKQEAQGDTSLHKKTENSKGVTKVTDAQGNALKETTETSAKTVVYTETILEQAAGQERPTRLSRTYTKAAETKNKEVEPWSVEGKTVLIEKKGSQYEFRVEGGGEVTGKAAEALDREFNKRQTKLSEQELMPKKAVKLNETWTIDAAVMAKSMTKDVADLFDFTKGKFTGKLLRVYQKDQRQFGVIEFAVELPVKAGFAAPNGLKLQGGKATMQVTLDGCIDGTSFARTMKGPMSLEMRGSAEANGMQFTIAMDMTGTEEEVVEDVSKK